MLTVLAIVARANGQIASDTTITVPVGGNGWLNKNAKAVIGDKGLSGWSASGDTLSVYVYLQAAGELHFAVKLSVPAGTSKLKLFAGKKVFTKAVSNRDTALVDFGKTELVSPGYIQLKMIGLSKTGAVYADVADLVLSGTALAKGAAYVKNNEGNYYYWGHRGPSVHLNYKMPADFKNDIEWFYNEVTVPKGNDVIGSYFMANGFSAGYFGMQVNSATERRILFSVWSPFKTDDSKQVPDSLKIRLLKKGEGVHTGEFGGEGSGGQSYMVFPWEAGKTYAFLTRAQPDKAANTSTFTCYFKEAPQKSWQLIASFKRPTSAVYLKGLYSFLENFDADMGQVERRVLFGNQWVIDTSGKWYAITNAKFTGDATANINYRKDYAGGVEGARFYLRNCGFFNDFTPLNSNLNRGEVTVNHPEIAFNALP